ncbi:conserved hypothetical protein [Agrobacterium genomosp. 2 str. CFBP 5494]|uniref:Uncharacterized protein n=1 Tax=Agrobacterium genomosp. 2 str. CFBP 5494 TaxID=1183436 RepID=A0A9W5B5D4_9HYPH|nr:conserved hypothetical protein [Agrobacterium genomosp. 2 str. CFBP 5494]
MTHYTKGTPSPLRAPTVCRHPVSGSISLPSSGCFSPFPHGTCSLSVMHEYLGLESGLPMFRQDFTCPALLKDNDCSTRKGLSPSMADFSKSFRFIHHCHWPGPRSLATTCGVSVDVLSCRYLRMFQFPAFASYPYVFESKIPYHNAWKRPFVKTDWIFQAFKVGCPIRRSMDQSLFAAPHGFSQRITSFFACACQGIHQMPLIHFFVLIVYAHP